MPGAALNFKEKGISADYLFQACVIPDQGLVSTQRFIAQVNPYKNCIFAIVLQICI